MTIETAANYLQQVVGNDVTFSKREAVSSLPNHLLWDYDLYDCQVGERRCVLALVKDGARPTPAAISRNMGQIAQAAGADAVYVGEGMAGYDRQRLVGKRTPFIVPGRQLYLPFLAAAFTERGTKKPRVFDALGNAAQLLFVRWLSGLLPGVIGIADAVAHSGYTKQSVIRAFDELECFAIGRRRQGDHHFAFSGAPLAAWEEHRDRLKNPCRRRVGLAAMPAGVETAVAGTEALSLRGMLAPPAQREIAVFHTDGARLPALAAPLAEAPIIAELWDYRPTLMPDGGVDPFSLWLTLAGSPDERVQGCLEEMLGAAR